MPYCAKLSERRCVWCKIALWFWTDMICPLNIFWTRHDHHDVLPQSKSNKPIIYSIKPIQNVYTFRSDHPPSTKWKWLKVLAHNKIRSRCIRQFQSHYNIFYLMIIYMCQDYLSGFDEGGSRSALLLPWWLIPAFHFCPICAGITSWGGGDQHYCCQDVHAGCCICRPVPVWHDPHVKPCQSFAAAKYLLQDPQLWVYPSHSFFLSYPSRTVKSLYFNVICLLHNYCNN